MHTFAALTKTVFFLLCLACFFGASSQDSIARKGRWFKTMVQTNEGYARGLLYKANDSGLVLIDNLLNQQTLNERWYRASDLKLVKLQRKGSLARGAVLGFVAGAILGVIIGFASGDDPCADPNNPDCNLTSVLSFRAFSAGEKALIYGWSLGLVGGGAGVAIGSIKIKIPINNNTQTFLENKERLKNYSMVK